MTISRGQMSRELYGLGSLVKKITGGAKKAVKKVAGGIGDILSSDIGKAALLAYGTYKLGPMIGSKIGMPKVPDFLTGKVAKNIGIGLAGSLLGGVMAKAQQGDEEAIAATRNVDSLRSYLTQGYRNLKSFVKELPKSDVFHEVAQEIPLINNLIVLLLTNSYLGISKLVGAGPFLILPEVS